jgi:hypothetical protein
MKQLVDETDSRKNGKLIKWQFDKAASRLKGKLMKQKVY